MPVPSTTTDGTGIAHKAVDVNCRDGNNKVDNDMYDHKPDESNVICPLLETSIQLFENNYVVGKMPDSAINRYL